MDETKQKLRGGQFAVWLTSEVWPINFTLTARIRGTFTPDQFHSALGKLRLKYPPLSTRVSSESKGSVYLITDPDLKIPVRIIERSHAESWLAEVTSELDQAFDLLNQPPIRLVWLRGEDLSEIIFVCPHAMTDGFSVAYLVRDFLIFLGDPAAEVQPMPSAPAMSESIPNFSGKRMIIWQSKLKAAFMGFFLRHRTEQGRQPEAKVDPARLKYHLLAWSLTAKQTAALVARCRAEKTTVHAALSTAFLRSFGEFHADGWNRKIQSPISLRDRLTSPAGEAFGLYVNLVEFLVNCSPQRNFWEVAREIKQTLIRRTADPYIFRSLIEGNVIMDELGAIVTPDIVSRSFLTVDYDLSITNLGRLDFPTQVGPLQLDALYGPSLGGNPQDIVLGVITVGGKMHFTLSFTDLKLNSEQAEQIKGKAMHWLEEAADWGK